MTMLSFLDKHIRADVTVFFTGIFRQASASPIHLKMDKLSAPFLDYEAAARAAGWTYSKADGYWRHPTYTQPYSYAHTLCGCEGIPPHEIPIIGHYIVTSELADKLSARGERVELDFGGNIVWARKKSRHLRSGTENKRCSFSSRPRPCACLDLRKGGVVMHKLFSTLRILFHLFMARTFGEYVHTVWNGTFRYAEYKWRGKTYYFPMEGL